MKSAWIRAAGAALALTLTILALPASAADAPSRPGRWVQANQVLLRTELTGQGDDVVVLVHDMGLNLECWDEVMPAIQPGRRVLRYDIRWLVLSYYFLSLFGL
jgi:hypothetical protein